MKTQFKDVLRRGFTPKWRMFSLGAALVTGVMFNGCTGSNRAATDVDSSTTAPTVGVSKVDREDLSRNLVLAAEFHPFQEIEVHAKVAGFVKAMYVDVGDHVKEGQLLALIEIPELQDEVIQAEAGVRRSAEEIHRAQEELTRSQSAHEVSHLAYQRLAEVTKTQPHLVAQQDIDDSLGRDRVAEAQVAAARAALAAAQQQLEMSKANQKRLQTLLGYARITAPSPGPRWRRLNNSSKCRKQTRRGFKPSSGMLESRPLSPEW